MSILWNLSLYGYLCIYCVWAIHGKNILIGKTVPDWIYSLGFIPVIERLINILYGQDLKLCLKLAFFILYMPHKMFLFAFLLVYFCGFLFKKIKKKSFNVQFFLEIICDIPSSVIWIYSKYCFCLLVNYSTKFSLFISSI